MSGREVVAVGVFPSGLRWEIEASGNDADFMTMLMVRRGDDLVSGSGMGGPKLYEGKPVHASYGVSDDLPCSEVVRTDPSVDRVVVVTEHGTQLEVQLTEPHPRYGLRFGAVELPAGQLPDELWAESSGQVVHRETQHGLRRWPGRRGPDGGGLLFGR